MAVRRDVAKEVLTLNRDYFRLDGGLERAPHCTVAAFRNSVSVGMAYVPD
jgi:hypothetical protein